jgi:hypothetical protein
MDRRPLRESDRLDQAMNQVGFNQAGFNQADINQA